MSSRFILVKEGPQICLNSLGEGRRLLYWEAGSGETIVAIADGERPSRAHALLAERRRVIVFGMTAAEAGTPQEAARLIGAAVAALGIERFDLMGEGTGDCVRSVSVGRSTQN